MVGDRLLLRRNLMNGGKTGVPEGVNLGKWDLVERVIDVGVKSPVFESCFCTYCVILGKSLYVSGPKREDKHPGASLTTRARIRVRRVGFVPWVQN